MAVATDEVEEILKQARTVHDVLEGLRKEDEQESHA